METVFFFNISHKLLVYVLTNLISTESEFQHAFNDAELNYISYYLKHNTQINLAIIEIF